MKRQILSIGFTTVFTLAGCATSPPPAAAAPSGATATAPQCCCPSGPCWRGGRSVSPTPTTAAMPTTRPFGPRLGRAMGAGPRGGRGFGGGMGMQVGMPQEMAPIHSLLDQHELIQREVKDIAGGVETTTTSATPAIAETIRSHTKQMKERLESGQPIRMWDPLFVELFRHHDQIKMAITDVPGGVRVVETSDDPQVTLLIRQHAKRGVSEFVARGYDRAHEASPLPSGDAPPSR